MKKRNRSAADLRYRTKKPWVRFVEFARRRCGAKSGAWRKYYRDKGIQCHLDASDAEFLWKRDHAAGMARPSLDRIDPDKNYTVGNCRFIEFHENAKLGLSKKDEKALGLK